MNKKEKNIENEGRIERLKELIADSKLSDRQFAFRLGMDPSGLSKRLSGEVIIGPGTINRVILNIEVNREWIEKGIGEKYSKLSPYKVPEENEPVIEDPEPPYGNKKEEENDTEFNKEIIKNLVYTISSQQKTIEYLTMNKKS